MAAVSVPPGKQTFIGPQTGAPLEFGTVVHYVPNTSLPKLTWADESQSTANPQVITLDAGGSCTIWGVGLYRQVLTDQHGVQIWDQITGFVGGGSGGGDVFGPGASVVGHVATWGSTDGTQLNDGGALGNLAFLNTITSSLVTDFASSARAVTAAQLVQGTNVTITPVGSTLVIAASLGGGAVSGPGSSLNGELVLFNGTTGAVIKNSGVVPSANMLTFLAATTFANMRSVLGLGTAALAASTDFEPAGAYSGTNAQTGTSYTLVLGDKGLFVTMNNASANTLTVPPNSSVAYPVLSRIDLQSLGAGQTTIAAGAGVTINSAGGALKLRVRYSGASLIKTATDTWSLIGDIST